MVIEDSCIFLSNADSGRFVGSEIQIKTQRINIIYLIQMLLLKSQSKIRLLVICSVASLFSSFVC